MEIRSPIEERWNWLTHGFGFLLSVLGFIMLLILDSGKTGYSTFSLILYASSLLILYFSSTVYHYSNDYSLKEKLRIMDHICIYLLIAGTYSPVTLIGLLDSKGWFLFSLVWGIAIFGSVLKLFYTGRFEVLSLILYVIMGWLIVWDIQALMEKVGSAGITYLILGGGAYTLGIIFYLWEKLKFNHVIWHFFVLAGSIFHYVFILKFII